MILSQKFPPEKISRRRRCWEGVYFSQDPHPSKIFFHPIVHLFYIFLSLLVIFLENFYFFTFSCYSTRFKLDESMNCFVIKCKLFKTDSSNTKATKDERLKQGSNESNSNFNLSNNFLIDVQRIKLNDFINCSFNLFVCFLL